MLQPLAGAQDKLQAAAGKPLGVVGGRRHPVGEGKHPLVEPSEAVGSPQVAGHRTAAGVHPGKRVGRQVAAYLPFPL